MAIASHPGRVGRPAAIELYRAVASAAALRSATELGVVDLLRGEGASADEVARDCGLSATGAALLLEALASLELLTQDAAGRYAAAENLGDLLGLVECYARLTPALRDEPQTLGVELPRGAAAHYPQVVDGIADFVAEAAERAADLLATTPPSRLSPAGGCGPHRLGLRMLE